MNNETITSAYSRAVDSAMPLIDDSLKAIRNAEREIDDVLAAVRGGSTSFGSESEVKEAFSKRKRDAVSRGMTAVEKLRASMQEVVDDALSFDPADVSAVAPALAIKGLSDGDLRSLAKRYRNSRGALMAIAQHDAKYCSNIGVALADYSDTVSGACRKAADFSERSLLGLNGIKDAATLRSYIDDQKSAIQSAWDDLQSAIDGSADSDPLRTALYQLSRKD